MTAICEFAPAKVNLTLEVLGRRADGFHQLRSLVAFSTDTGDIVTLDTAKPVAVTTSGPFASSIAGANLAETTLRLIERQAPDLQLGAVHLEKNLPVAAGIGGGSADAAALMRAIKRANRDRADIDWISLALKLGADVPVCLQATLSWMTGFGEKVHPIVRNGKAAIPAVIANPLIAVPPDKTAQVFGALNAELLTDDAPWVPTATRLPQARDIVAAARDGHNVLEAPARKTMPALDDVLAALSACPRAVLVRMSGAGPTCFALFEKQADAQAAASMLAEIHPQWWIRATSLR